MLGPENTPTVTVALAKSAEIQPSMRWTMDTWDPLYLYVLLRISIVDNKWDLLRYDNQLRPLEKSAYIF